MANETKGTKSNFIEKLFTGTTIKRVLIILIAASIGLGVGVSIAKPKKDDNGPIVSIVDDEIIEDNYILTITNIKEVLEPARDLITTKYYYTDSNTYENYKELFGQKVPFTTDKVIFTYDGVISVGVDLSRLRYSIDHNEKIITITLPKVKILANELDESSFEFPYMADSIFNATEMDDYVELLGRLKQERADELMANTAFMEDALENTKSVIEKFLTASDVTKKYEVVFK